MNFAIAVKAFIVKDQSVLVIKRRPTDVHKPSQWDIPGGCLALGEDPFYGLQREAKEEVGLPIAIKAPLTVQHFTRDDGQVITMLIFWCEAQADTIQLSEEHTDHAWLPLAEADTLPEWLQSVTNAYQQLHLPATSAMPVV